MVGSSALPTSLKLKLGARYLPFLATTARALDANDLATAAAAALDTSSVKAWGERELGHDFVELLAYPLLAAYYGGAPESLSAALYHALARVGMDVRVYAVQGGAAALPRAIGDWLAARGATVSIDVAVTAVAAADGGVRVEWADGQATHDAVVVATPATAALSLLGDVGPAGEWLRAVRSAPTLTAAFVLDAPLDREWFGLSFPRASEPGARIAAIAAQSRKLPSLVPDGREVIVVYPAPPAAAELFDATPQAVVDALGPALEAAFPGIGARIERARVYPFEDGYTLFAPGYLQHLQRFDPGWLPGHLALAGDYLVAPSVEGAVRSGQRAAARLLGSA
jgi:oxygen-dependent protoporphyrinogen oxidase